MVPDWSMPEFLGTYGTEAQCEQALEAIRWPGGFRGPRCECTAHYVLRDGVRKGVLKCRSCRHQASLMAGTVFQGYQAAIDHLVFWRSIRSARVKTAWSALALKRELGVSYPHRMADPPQAHAGHGRPGRLRA